MIVVDIALHSTITGKTENLGTMIIDNLGTGTNTHGNYRCRMYKKGDVDRVGGARKLHTAKPIRQAIVLDHRRLAEPVGNLVSKALQAMNYE